MGSRSKAEQPQQARVQRLARASLLAAVALILSYIETMIPLPVALPGVKLGLANIAVVVALFALDAPTACAVAAVKVLASGFLFGSPMMLAYSLGGMALALASMLLLRFVPGISVVVVSMASAICHNVGQIAVACAMLSAPAVFLSLPPLAVAACITGALTGAVARGVLASVQRGGAVPGRATSSLLSRLAAWEKKRAAAGQRKAVEETAGAGASKAEAGSDVSLDASACNAEAAANGGASLGASRAQRKVKRRAMRASAPARASRTMRKPSASTGSSFGVYCAGQSLAHRLDPRTKLLFTVLFFVIAFAAQGPMLAVMATLAVASLAASGMGPVSALAMLRPFKWLVLFVAVWDALFTTGGEVLFRAGALCLTSGGLLFAGESVLRFCCMLLGTSALMRTTSPTQLTDGFAGLLAPFSKLGTWVDDAALALGLTFRFIPTLAEEHARIRRAQESRAACFEGGVASRLQAYVSVFTPLFAGALRQADSVAVAISSRCYGCGKTRSSIREYRMTAADWAVLAVAVVALFASLSGFRL